MLGRAERPGGHPLTWRAVRLMVAAMRSESSLLSTAAVRPSMDAIDLFAGAGGFTTGAEQAGCRVLWAANHWPAAVKVHAENHPDTEHLCQDLLSADWAEVPEHEVMLCSPSCTGHTKARGKDRPHHDLARSTAWAVVSAAEYHRPRVVIVENVPEFRDWALYPSWLDAMTRLGYAAAPYVVDAADFGVPQHRVRLFIVLTRSAAPIELDLPKLAHKPARNIVEVNAGRWRLISDTHRPLKPNTLARIAAGRVVFGERFLIAYYGNSKSGRSLDRPLGTVTTHDRYAIIDGDRMRMLTVDECRAAMGFPGSYRLAVDRKTAVHLLGNAVCPPVAKHLIDAVKAAV